MDGSFRTESSTCSPIIVLEKLRKLFSMHNISFNLAKIAIDFGGGFTRLTLNPLIPKFKEFEVNQHYLFCFPLLVSNQKEKLEEIPKNFLSTLPVELILTLDLGCWFSVEKSCPYCFKNIAEFQDFEGGPVSEETISQKFAFVSCKRFVFCSLHLVTRIIITIFQLFVINSKREKELEEIIKKDVRKSFKYGGDEDSFIVCRPRIWLTLNECLVLIRHNDIDLLLELNENEKDSPVYFCSMQTIEIIKYLPAVQTLIDHTIPS